MEKYRKFADEKNGINPFINAPKVQKRNLLQNIARIPLILLGIIKFIVFIGCYLQFSLNQFLRHVFIIRQIKRILEVLFAKVYGFILLILLGVFKFTPMKGNKEINVKTKKTVILSSQSNVIDWISLMYIYVPKFLVIVKDNDQENKIKKDLLIELNYFEVLKYALGINIAKFDNADEKKTLTSSYNYFDLEKDFINTNDFTPIVIFPEGTKTTREATLSIRSSVMDDIYKNLMLNKIQVACHVSLYKYKYFCPNNTVERKGIKNLFETVSQLYNEVLYFSILLNKNNFDTSLVDRTLVKAYSSEEYYYDSLVQENLTHPEFRNNKVSLTCLDGLKFLEFYEKTATNTDYVKEN